MRVAGLLLLVVVVVVVGGHSHRAASKVRNTTNTPAEEEAPEVLFRPLLAQNKGIDKNSGLCLIVHLCGSQLDSARLISAQLDLRLV